MFIYSCVDFSITILLFSSWKNSEKMDSLGEGEREDGEKNPEEVKG